MIDMLQRIALACCPLLLPARVFEFSTFYTHAWATFLLSLTSCQCDKSVVYGSSSVLPVLWHKIFNYIKFLLLNILTDRIGSVLLHDIPAHRDYLAT